MNYTGLCRVIYTRYDHQSERYFPQGINYNLQEYVLDLNIVSM
jgi:hypothetical protein